MGKTDIADAGIAPVRAPCLSNSRKTADPVAFGSGKPCCAGQAPQCVSQRGKIITHHKFRDNLADQRLLGSAIFLSFFNLP
nr:hypothetical protein [Sphingomonas sp. H160509]